MKGGQLWEHEYVARIWTLNIFYLDSQRLWDRKGEAKHICMASPQWVQYNVLYQRQYWIGHDPKQQWEVGEIDGQGFNWQRTLKMASDCLGPVENLEGYSVWIYNKEVRKNKQGDIFLSLLNEEDDETGTGGLTTGGKPPLSVQVKMFGKRTLLHKNLSNA